jgi:hypothetical protein
MRKSTARRGAILLMALFFTVLATTGSLILINVMPSGAASLRLLRRDVESNQAAEAGIRDCSAWISHQLKNNIEPLTTATTTRTGSLGSYSWSAVITADSQTPPSVPTPNGIRMYKVESTVSTNGTPKRRVTCWLQAGTNFTKYAAFTENTPTASFVNFFIYKNQQTVDGAFRTNGTLKVGIPTGYYGGVTTPAFNGLLSASGSTGIGDGIDYSMGLSGPTTATEYQDLHKLGKPGFAVGISPMNVPTGTAPIKDSAWGGTAPGTIPAGVTVNPSGGVAIGGDVDDMVLSVDGGSNPVVTITQGATVTKVTRVTDSPVGGAPVGSRLVQVGATSTVVAGLGTGVVFSSGDVRQLKGTNKGATTIAADYSTGKSIEIVGPLLRADTPIPAGVPTVAGLRPTSTRDPLGLIGQEVRVTDNVLALPRNHDVLNIYANIFANDRFLVEQRNNASLGQGKMAVFGSILGRNSWNTSSYDIATSSVLSGFGHPSGFGGFKLTSDPNADFFPPPQFPASEKGQIEIRYWKEQAL